MRKNSSVQAVLTLVWIAIASFASDAKADQVTEQIIASSQMTETVKLLGLLCLSGKKTSSQIDHDKAEVRERVYWAFSPDVHLSDAERALESNAFDEMWTELIATSQKYNVDEVSFVGCDAVALLKCLDMYYVGITPNGPVVFKFSMEFEVGDHARLIKVQTITQWDTVKDLLKAIEHPVDRNQIPTISWPKSRATTQPLATSRP